MRIFFLAFCLFLSPVFAQKTTYDTCSESLEKHCSKGLKNEARWVCLSKYYDQLPAICQASLHKETEKTKGPCYISSLALCGSDDLRKNYICLTERLTKVSPECKESLIKMQETGMKFKKLIREKCAEDFTKFCPGMDEVNQTNCLTKVYQSGKTSLTCSKTIESATIKKR